MSKNKRIGKEEPGMKKRNMRTYKRGGEKWRKTTTKKKNSQKTDRIGPFEESIFAPQNHKTNILIKV